MSFRSLSWLLCGALFLSLASAVLAEKPSWSFEGRDTISPMDRADESETAENAVESNHREQLHYTPSTFTVEVDPAQAPWHDAVVKFQSAKPVGQALIDTVQVEWRYARVNGEPIDVFDENAEKRPAIVLVHSVHPDLLVSRTFAMELSNRGIHCFLILMPGYLDRHPEDKPWSPVFAIEHSEMAVADIRRARDVVSQIPGVQQSSVSLLGLSMGGFIAATTNSLDLAYEPLFLVLSGADISEVLTHGELDAKSVAWNLARAGYTGDKLKQLIALADPVHLAHRLDAAKTYLIRAQHDRVIPPHSYDALEKIVKLPESHVLRLEANHYTSAFFFGQIADYVTKRILQSDEATEAAEEPTTATSQ